MTTAASRRREKRRIRTRTELAGSEPIRHQQPRQLQEMGEKRQIADHPPESGEQAEAPRRRYGDADALARFAPLASRRSLPAVIAAPRLQTTLLDSYLTAFLRISTSNLHFDKAASIADSLLAIREFSRLFAAAFSLAAAHATRYSASASAASFSCRKASA